MPTADQERPMSAHQPTRGAGQCWADPPPSLPQGRPQAQPGGVWGTKSRIRQVPWGLPVCARVATCVWGRRSVLCIQLGVVLPTRSAPSQNHPRFHWDTLSPVLNTWFVETPLEHVKSKHPSKKLWYFTGSGTKYQVHAPRPATRSPSAQPHTRLCPGSSSSEEAQRAVTNNRASIKAMPPMDAGLPGHPEKPTEARLGLALARAISHRDTTRVPTPKDRLLDFKLLEYLPPTMGLSLPGLPHTALWSTDHCFLVPQVCGQRN